MCLTADIYQCKPQGQRVFWSTLDEYDIVSSQICFFGQYLVASTDGIACNNQNVSVITWSQVSLNMQWAMKYWPSTRAVVSNFVPVSPDLKGSTVAYIGEVPPPQGILPLGEFSNLFSNAY
jgi:hypothetical protein